MLRPLRVSDSDLYMLRGLAIFVMLFLGGAACLSLLPTPPLRPAPQSAVAAQLQREADPAVASAKVRVVYPDTGSDSVHDASVRPALVATPVNAAVPSQAIAQTAAVYPQAKSAESIDPVPAITPNAAAVAGTSGLNLNTASIDALNQIPGAGRIGRTIASHRPYRSVEDLLTKRVVKKSVYDKIKDQLAAE